MSSNLRASFNKIIASKEKIFFIYVWVVSLFAWGITAFRAAITGITYDEAFTAIYYARSWNGFLIIDLANNHPINSLLIFLSTYLTGQRYSELAVRLPNLLAFGLYLFAAYHLAKRFKYPFLTFSLLALNYYLDEFFGLARGYGLSAAFVLIAMWIYFSDRKSERHLLFALLFLVLSSAAIYANLVLMACFSLYIALVDIGLSKLWMFVRHNLAVLLVLFAVCLYMAYVFADITGGNKPLFGASGQNFFRAIPLSFAAMFTTNETRKLILSILCGAILFAAMLTQRQHLERLPFTGLLLTTFLVTYLISLVLHKPLPTDRILLPLYPVLALALVESTQWLLASLPIKPVSNAFLVGLGMAALLLLVNYTTSIHLAYTTDWKDDYAVKMTTYVHIIRGQPVIGDPATGDRTPIQEFYVTQLNKEYRVDSIP